MFVRRRGRLRKCPVSFLDNLWRTSLLTECRYGVFRLTDPPGMPNVLNCTKTGLFHPHPETDTYTDAMKPGHVHIADIAFETVDLRP